MVVVVALVVVVVVLEVVAFAIEVDSRTRGVCGGKIGAEALVAVDWCACPLVMVVAKSSCELQTPLAGSPLLLGCRWCFCWCFCVCWCWCWW